MRKTISSLFNSLDRYLHEGMRNDFIKHYDMAIEYGVSENIYTDAQKLIEKFPYDKVAAEAYFDGVYRLENMIGAEDYRAVAMAIAAMPLQPQLTCSADYRQAAIEALIHICPRHAAEEYNIVEAVAYLDIASSYYRDFPSLSSDAINTSIDLINGLAAHKPEIAANIAANFFPEEHYMFKDDVAEKMKAQRHYDPVLAFLIV